jgi:hypothetical protein
LKSHILRARRGVGGASGERRRVRRERGEESSGQVEFRDARAKRLRNDSLVGCTTKDRPC